MAPIKQIQQFLERLLFTPLAAVLVAITAATVSGPAGALFELLREAPGNREIAISILCFAGVGFFFLRFAPDWLRGGAAAMGDHPVAVRAILLAFALAAGVVELLRLVPYAWVIEIATGLIWAYVLFRWMSYVARAWLKRGLSWRVAAPRWIVLAALPIFGALASELAGDALWTWLAGLSGTTVSASWGGTACVLLGMLLLSGLILSRAPIYLGSLMRTKNACLQGYGHSLRSEGAPIRKIVLAMSALKQLGDAQGFANAVEGVEHFDARRDLTNQIDLVFREHPWHQPVRVLRMILADEAPEKNPRTREVVVFVANENYLDERRGAKRLEDDPEYRAFLRVLQWTLTSILGGDADNLTVRILQSSAADGRISIYKYEEVFDALKAELSYENGRGAVVDITSGRSTFSAAAMAACLQTHARVAYLHMRNDEPVLNTEQVYVGEARTVGGG